MSTPKPLLPLSPAERRIAEVAFALSLRESAPLPSAAWAIKCVLDTRAGKPVRCKITDEDADAMLAELRREPEPDPRLARAREAMKQACDALTGSGYLDLDDTISECERLKGTVESVARFLAEEFAATRIETEDPR